jgi:hypothetical protein
MFVKSQKTKRQIPNFKNQSVCPAEQREASLLTVVIIFKILHNAALRSG